MIKVEVEKTTDGRVTTLVFTTNNPSDQSELDNLDTVIRLVAGQGPRRSGFAESGVAVISFLEQ
jgi:hypothetical protein